MERTIRLLIAYDGSNYCGWQRQRQGEPTIQEAVERQLSRLCDETITLHGAGRTDTGVHALGMVAHLHTRSTIPVPTLARGLNALLARDIRILAAEAAPAHFHSRFNVLGKTYRYDFCTAALHMPCARHYQAHLPGPFDLQRLEEALPLLLGTHDFSSFERSGSRDKTAVDGRGAVRTLTAIACTPKLGLPECWSIRVTGDGFLRQMVRILAGTLIDIGQGKRHPHDVQTILAGRDRRLAGLTAPACGLFLEQIYYPFPVFTAHIRPCSPPASP